MSLNPMYITAPSLQSYFVDKDSGAPLSGGKIFFYRDNNRTTPKAVYEIQGVGTNYTYVPLPNPVILSAVGTFADNNGNDILPYYYPFDAEGAQDLYYIVVQNSNGVPQFVRPAWPNPNGGSSPSGGSEIFNHIPNGQFLAHTNLPNNALVPGTNVIAQGGWSIELDSGATSKNTLTWITEPYTQDPPQSPRYVGNFICTQNLGSEQLKNLRCRFNDVNKFTDQGSYTFAIWLQSTFAFNATVEPYYFFGTGGSPAAPVFGDPTVITVTPEGTLFNVTINFGSNAGDNIGTNNDDFVTVDVSFPTDANINVQFCDAVLLPGMETITAFPTQTNADMIARGIFGWTDLPNPTGFDLYLPPILTKYGMTWDNSSIGNVGMSLLPILSPLSTTPIPDSNMMPCDGTSYTTSVSSSNGIPFQRLFNYLYSSALGLPITGTGLNYLSAVPLSGSANVLKLIYNTAGVSSILAADGAASTGFSFSYANVWNGVNTGTNYFGITALYQAASATVLVQSTAGGWLANPNVGTSTMAITNLATDTSIQAFQYQSFYVQAVAGSALVTGSAGLFFSFSSSSVNYYMWFNTGTETDPAVGGRTGIQVLVDSFSTAQDVANAILYAMNGFFVSRVDMPSTNGLTGTHLPPNNSYFTFSTNPGSPRNFFVWFNVGGIGVAPIIPGVTGIEVAIALGSTTAQLNAAIVKAINSYQFAAPDFRGMFFRNSDPNSTWDIDAQYRWSTVPGLAGNVAATFEFQQLLKHFHSSTNTNFLNNPGSGGTVGLSGGSNGVNSANTAVSGGTETRPVNVSVYPFIKY